MRHLLPALPFARELASRFHRCPQQLFSRFLFQAQYSALRTQHSGTGGRLAEVRSEKRLQRVPSDRRRRNEWSGCHLEWFQPSPWFDLGELGTERAFGHFRVVGGLSP